MVDHMTVAEFIRLRPSPDDDPTADRRTFVCELPDAESEDDNTWLDCGRVLAFATQGSLSSVDIELNEVFAGEFDNRRYDPEEVVGVIILWVGWESRWTAMDKVQVRLRDAWGTSNCVYSPLTDRVNCGNRVP